MTNHNFSMKMIGVVLLCVLLIGQSMMPLVSELEHSGKGPEETEHGSSFLDDQMEGLSGEDSQESMGASSISGTRGGRGILEDLYVGNEIVDVRWPKISGSFSRYVISRDGENQATITNRNITTYRDGTLTKDTKYTYRFESYNGTGSLVDSGEVTVTTGEVHGTITQATTWTSASSPYALSDNIQVEDNVQLSIENNVVVNSNIHEMNIFGTLTPISWVTVQGNGFSVQDCNTVSISNCTFNGSTGTDQNIGLSLKNCTGTMIQVSNIASYSGFGIKLDESNRSSVENSNISHNGDGIALTSSGNCTLGNNTLWYNGQGIHGISNSPFTVLFNNAIRRSTDYAVFMETGCDNLTVDRNTMEQNGISGLYIRYSPGPTITNNIMGNNSAGVGILGSDGARIQDNTFEAMTGNGIAFSNSDGFLVERNSVSGCLNGISLLSIEGGTIADNTFQSGRSSGILTNYVVDTVVSDNTISSNTLFGVRLSYSKDLTLSGNIITDHSYNFRVDGLTLDYYIHTIDATNTVDGKPIRYWVNQNSGTIPSDAGFVGIINCNGVTSRQQTISNAYEGILVHTSFDCVLDTISVTDTELGMYILDSGRITITGCTISNNREGMKLYRSNDNTVTWNNASNNTNTGILFHTSSGNRIENNTATMNWQGIGLTKSNENTVTHNTCYENDAYGIGDGQSNNNIFELNNCSDQIGSQEGDTSGLNIVGVSQCRIANNTCVGNDNGISVSWSADVNISQNNVTGNEKRGIYIYDTDDTAVHNNTAIDCAYGIELNVSKRNVVSLNNVSESGDIGLYLYQSDENTVLGNDMNGTMNTGCYLHTSSENNLTGNQMQLNKLYGLFMNSSTSNRVAGNLISNNAWGAAEMSWFNGTNLTWYDNHTKENFTGIYLLRSNDNLMFENHVKNNTQYGIYLTESNSNTIYNNYFKNSWYPVSRNAFANAVNIWNISKAAGENILGLQYIGGNYWHDYMGNDTDGDLIGDTHLPYNNSGLISYGGDSCPLMKEKDIVVNLDTGERYDSIQDAVDAASSGDTILVYPGIYSENVDIDKSITIRAVEGKNETTVQALNTDDHVFHITDGDVRIEEFTIIGATGDGKAGIHLGPGSDSCTVLDCIISGNYHGIEARGTLLLDTVDVQLNNAAGIAVMDDAPQEITMYDTRILTNGDHGIFVFVNDLVLRGSNNMIMFNGGWGIRAETGTLDIKDGALTRISANIKGGLLGDILGIPIGLRIENNGGPGLVDMGSADAGTQPLVLEDIKVRNNEGHGIVGAAPIIIRGFANEISGNSGDGIHHDGGGLTIEGTGTVIKDNGGFGILADTEVRIKEGAMTDITDNEGGGLAGDILEIPKGFIIEDNGGPGLVDMGGADASTPSLVLTDIKVRNNDGNGIEGAAPIIIRGSDNEISGNTGDGIHHDGGGLTIEGSGTVVWNNGGFGILADTEVRIKEGAMTDITENGGGGLAGDILEIPKGFIIEDNGGPGLVDMGGADASTPSLILTDIKVRNNEGNGIEGAAPIIIRGSDNEISGNTGDGIHHDGGGLTIEGTGTVVWNNGGYGINADSEVRIKEGAMTDITDNGGGGLVGDILEIPKGFIIENNGGPGLIVLGSVSDKLFLTNIKVRNNGGIGIDSSPYLVMSGSESEVSNNEGHGIHTIGSVQMFDGMIANNAGYGIVYGDVLRIGNLPVVNNTLGGILKMTGGFRGGVQGEASPTSLLSLPGSIRGEVTELSTITNCEILDNGGYGITCGGSSPEIVGTTITGNRGGILCDNGSQPVIWYNNIHGNSQESNEYDIGSIGNGETIEAEYNWWGPGGSGSASFGENVNVANELDKEVEDETGSMTGTGTITLCNGYVVVEFSVSSSTSITILCVPDIPERSQWTTTGNQFIIMVNETDSVIDLNVKFNYKAEDVMEGGESSLFPYWRNGTVWEACSDSGVDTTDSGDFSGTVWVTFDSDSNPGPDNLFGITLGIALATVDDIEDDDIEEDDEASFVWYLLAFILVAGFIGYVFVKEFQTRPDEEREVDRGGERNDQENDIGGGSSGSGGGSETDDSNKGKDGDGGENDTGGGGTDEDILV